MNATADGVKELLSLRDVSDRLNVNREKVRRLFKDGRLSLVPVARTARSKDPLFDPADVDAFATALEESGEKLPAA